MRSSRIIYVDDRRSSIRVECPKCGEYGRFYILKTDRGWNPVVQHGVKRHGVKRLIKKLDPRVFKMVAKLNEYESAKLNCYLRARVLGVPTPRLNPFRPSISVGYQRRILDDLDPPRTLRYESHRAVHEEALKRLEEVLEFHGWWCVAWNGVVYAIPPNWDFAYKFYVKVGLNPIVSLKYDFEKSALAILKLRRLGFKNGIFWYGGEWLYTPLYMVNGLKGSIVRFSKLPKYPLEELIENVNMMGGSYVVGF